MPRPRAILSVLMFAAVAHAVVPSPFAQSVVNAYAVLHVKCVARAPDGAVELEVLRSIVGPRSGRIRLDGRTGGFAPGSEYLVALDEKGQLYDSGMRCGTIATLKVEAGRAQLCLHGDPWKIEKVAAAVAEARAASSAGRRVELCPPR